VKIIQTKEAPSAIGPYSQAVVVSGQVFVSGQIPIDPETGKFLGGEVAEQTDRVIRNLVAILNAAGSSLSSVMKTTVYLTDLGDFKEMNGVYARFFGDHRPARATVQVAALPLGAKIEIDAIARV
jgi:2-iminobutanoate/2-iminopropanoate deaminase